MTTASDIQQDQSRTQLDEYSTFVNRRLANNPHWEVVPPWLLLQTLRQALSQKGALDQAKKGLFYGKDYPELSRARSTPPQSPYPQAPDHLLELIHSVLGLRTEVDELFELVLTAIEEDHTVSSKFIDEGGDTLFYLQAMLGVFGKTILDGIENNTKKLTERYPDGFDRAKALNPDKAAEDKVRS